MKKLFLLFGIILFISGCVNSQNTKSSHNPPVCGDNLCEDSEKYYCLDCNLSCKSELCNKKIDIICDNCTKKQEELLPTLFENQIIIYNCLSEYYTYSPNTLIQHTISPPSNPRSKCVENEGCYLSGGGFGIRNGIKQDFIPGLVENGEIEVDKKENVGFEIHELAHGFTYYSLGEVPPWFSEGISIYTESRISCHPNQILSNLMDSSVPIYKKLKKNNINLNELTTDDEYYQNRNSDHIIGALYFLTLEKDYDCDEECISKILKKLYEYRKNCIGTCFENAKNLTNHQTNNNKDLRIQIITNKIIKEKSEEVIKKDLTPVFERLGINIQ